MKYKLTKAEFETLPEDTQKEYNLEGEEASLVIEGGPDVSKLEKKASIAEEHRKKAEAERDAAEGREAKLKEDMSKAGGNANKIKELEEQHTAELEKIRAERVQEQEAQKAKSNAQLVKEASEAFANEHFTIPGVMVDQFAKRLAVEEVNGQSVVRVLDADGNASALGLTDLQKEFLDNKEFAPIIKANVGTGGGATVSAGGGATQSDISKLSMTERVAMKKENPEQYAANFPDATA